jgi:hypothetical protein
VKEKHFIEDLKLEGQRVLTRVDFNVPLNDELQITDNGRIAAALPTIRYILEQGGKAILMSHLGRPEGERKEYLSLKPAGKELSRLLGQPVTLAPDCVGTEVETMVKVMQNRDVLLLENLRFHKEETKNEEEFCKSLGKRKFSSKSTSLFCITFTMVSTSVPTQSGANVTGCPSSLDNSFPAGFRLKYSFRSPSGRPKCDISIAFPPCSSMYRMVGRAAAILPLSVI